MFLNKLDLKFYSIETYSIKFLQTNSMKICQTGLIIFEHYANSLQILRMLQQTFDSLILSKHPIYLDFQILLVNCAKKVLICM